jgi:predicted acetyltransferase
MKIRVLDMTRASEAMAATGITATAFRSGGRYRELMKKIEQSAGRPLPDPALEDPARQVWGAIIDEKLASVLTAISFSMRFEAQAIPMCGVGGVATLPEYRRRGAVRLLISEMLQSYRKKGFVFSYLFPFSFSYYSQFGYAPGCQRFRVSYPVNLLSCHRENGHVRHTAGLADLETIAAIYSRFTANTNGAVLRSRSTWEKMLKRDAEADQAHTYIWQDHDGYDRAWISFTTQCENNASELTIDDWASDSIESLTGLLAFLTRFASDYKTLHMRLPTDFDLTRLFPEVNALECRFQTYGQIRLLRVKKALDCLRRPAWLVDEAKRQSDPLGRFLRLNVTDDFITENRGVYILDLAGEQEVIHKKPDEKEAFDLTCDIRPLATLLLGSQNLETMLDHPEVTVSTGLSGDRLELFKRFFGTKKQGIYDHF